MILLYREKQIPQKTGALWEGIKEAGLEVNAKKMKYIMSQQNTGQNL